MLVSCPRNNRFIVAIKMGRRQSGPSRTGTKGAYLNRYVTGEQRSRRPIFIATLRAGASWLFFHVARSPRMTQKWVLRSRLEKQSTDLRRNPSSLRQGWLVIIAAAGSTLDLTYCRRSSSLVGCGSNRRQCFGGQVCLTS